MTKNLKKTLLLAVAIIATFTSGCRSTEEYRKFAEAGNNFAEATNLLLDSAGKIKIDTTSERVLSDRRVRGEFKPSDEARKKVIDNYSELSKPEKERLELIKELRKHNQFLQNYFTKLIELADSKSPDRTKTAVESIANQLQESGNNLVNLSPIKIDKLPSVTKIVLDTRIRGALKEELEKRKFVIYQEITTQEKVLKVIGDSMKNDSEIRRELREYRLVISPLLQPEKLDPDEDTWIKTRYEVLTQDAETISKINKVSDALREFKEIFIASIEGDITSKRLNNFLQSTNSLSILVSDRNEQK
jgi:hypothetical protein